MKRKKQSPKCLVKEPERCNPVAKHAAHLCKSATFRDRTKYFRKQKHKTNLASAMRLELQGV